MSTGYGVAQAAGYGNPSLSLGGPLNQTLPAPNWQQQQQNAAAPTSSIRPDLIGPSMEAVTPPLMPNMSSNAAAADAFANAQGSGLASVAILAGVLSVLACAGTPVLMEIWHTRAKQRSKMQQEAFEHVLRECVRDAKDPTLVWVRHLEEKDVNMKLVTLLAAEMHARWDTYVDKYKAAYKDIEDHPNQEPYQKAARNVTREALAKFGRALPAGFKVSVASDRTRTFCTQNNGGAEVPIRWSVNAGRAELNNFADDRHAEIESFVQDQLNAHLPAALREAAQKSDAVRAEFERVVALEIPVQELAKSVDARVRPEAEIDLKHGENPPYVPTEALKKISLQPRASFTINLLYHRVLAALKAQGKADNDNLRLVEQTTRAHIMQLLGYTDAQISTNRLGGRAPSRTLELDKKLVDIHEAAVARFMKLPVRV